MQQLRMRNVHTVCVDTVDPYTNLSLEEELFASCNWQEGEEFFLLYVNEPAVVFGKHQNPWKECNVQLLGERGIPLLRRISGGGTVYHDQGNINWSFIGPKEGFSQEENLEIIRHIAARFSDLSEADFTIGERGDIFYRELKISGNALTFKGNTALHHGTLLINSDLDSLGSSLRGWEKRFAVRLDGPAVNSNPSAVTNLSAHSRERLGFPEFYAAAVDYLRETGALAGEAQAPGLSESVIRRITEHRSADWTLRRTPDFRIFPVYDWLPDRPHDREGMNREGANQERAKEQPAWLVQKGRVYDPDGSERYDLCSPPELLNDAPGEGPDIKPDTSANTITDESPGKVPHSRVQDAGNVFGLTEFEARLAALSLEAGTD
ncbi:lipoate--protein ligase family protein [Salinispira pacifica]|nr:lipoate--protein ligase family protein [Salinispira pacifica]